jgi:hypothetical protein
VSTFGLLAGLGGLTHGVGEVLQGNVAADGIVIDSWTREPIATKLGGEPAMTIVPNLLVAGMLTILVSSALVVWAAAFVERRHGVGVLLLLTVVMLLVGGGFAPPVIGLLGGAAGLGAHLPMSTRCVPARLWPWAFAISAIDGAFLVAGSVVLVYAVGLNAPTLFAYDFLVIIPMLLVTVLAAMANDRAGGERDPGARDDRWVTAG